MRKEINLKRDIDPALYDSFFEKLKEILKRYSEDMEARFKAMKKLYKEMEKGRSGMNSDNGLDPEKEAPFYDLLIDKVFRDINIVDHEDTLKDITSEIVRIIFSEIKRINFWGTPAEIDRLKSNIGEILLSSDIAKLEDNEALIASEFVNLAKSRRDILVS
jgi:type I restriction enzyme R subunit